MGGSQAAAAAAEEDDDDPLGRHAEPGIHPTSQTLSSTFKSAPLPPSVSRSVCLQLSRMLWPCASVSNEIEAHASVAVGQASLPPARRSEINQSFNRKAKGKLLLPLRSYTASKPICMCF